MCSEGPGACAWFAARGATRSCGLQLGARRVRMDCWRLGPGRRHLHCTTITTWDAGLQLLKLAAEKLEVHKLDSTLDAMIQAVQNRMQPSVETLSSQHTSIEQGVEDAEFVKGFAKLQPELVKGVQEALSLHSKASAGARANSKEACLKVFAGIAPNFETLRTFAIDSFHRDMGCT